VPSHSGFFYDSGHPEGIFYEAFDEFQRFVNQKLKIGKFRTNVTFIPVRPEQFLRKQAASEGLDPNRWFGNVELVVAKGVGQETVRCISNIYKYYVAYKLARVEAGSKN
jgi:membrane-bound lytic murein transglycosylase MltF